MDWQRSMECYHIICMSTVHHGHGHESYEGTCIVCQHIRAAIAAQLSSVNTTSALHSDHGTPTERNLRNYEPCHRVILWLERQQHCAEQQYYRISENRRFKPEGETNYGPHTSIYWYLVCSGSSKERATSLPCTALYLAKRVSLTRAMLLFVQSNRQDSWAESWWHREVNLSLVLNVNGMKLSRTKLSCTGEWGQ